MGQSEPLNCITKVLAKELDLLCFDEFFCQ
ncbi:MAG TPA: hypothetical protein DIS98_14485 [Colwellia sp.]|nr:hypothetical protein [Colwellia sp.]